LLLAELQVRDLTHSAARLPLIGLIQDLLFFVVLTINSLVGD
jgi:hypothetical protein